MEGEKRRLISLAIGKNSGDALPHLPEQGLGHFCLMEAGRTEDHPNVPPLPWWTPHQQSSYNYDKYYGSSEFLHHGFNKDILDDIPSPFYDINVVTGDFDKPPDIFYMKPRESLSSKPASYYLDLNLLKIGCLSPQIGGQAVTDQTTSAYNQTISQSCTSWEQKLQSQGHNVPQTPLRLKVAESSYRSRRRDRKRALETDLRRRKLIKERLKAVQELLPGSNEGSEAAAWDDIIAHVKNLQNQVKELTQTRLGGGESETDSYIFLEGYGHCLVNARTLSQPLEEMIGKLLEVNPVAASQLLESRGLFAMPMGRAEGLCKTIQMITGSSV